MLLQARSQALTGSRRQSVVGQGTGSSVLDPADTSPLCVPRREFRSTTPSGASNLNSGAVFLSEAVDREVMPHALAASDFPTLLPPRASVARPGGERDPDVVLSLARSAAVNKHGSYAPTTTTSAVPLAIRSVASRGSVMRGQYAQYKAIRATIKPIKE